MSQNYKPGDTVWTEFITSVFATGAAANADSLPTGTVQRNGADDGTVTVTVTNVDTGRYKATFTIPATYVPGDVLALSIAATVSTVAGKGVIWQSRVGPGLIRASTAGGGAVGSITLDGSASATTDFYKGSWIVLVSQTGAGQIRLCTAYNGSTKVASVAPNWATAPDNTSVFTILPAAGVDVQSINGVSTSNVTTVNANIGETQPINFTGTGAAALVKSDSVDIGGSAAASATVGTVTNVTNGVTLAASQHVIVDSGTVTNLTNLPSIPTNWLTSAGIAAGALNGKGDWNTTVPPTVAAIATAVWTDTTAGDFTVALSVGKSVMNGVALGTGLTINSVTNDVTLAANQHVIVDSGTVTNLTNLPSIPTNWLTAAGIATGALNGKGDWPSSVTIAGAVWDVTLASHLTAGSTGFALNAAGSAGDPWGTQIPGAYGAGTAGHRLGNIPDIAAGSTNGLPVVGSAMTLTVAYDAAKTAAPAGAQMDLVNAPNTTALTAFVAAINSAFVEGTITKLQYDRIMLSVSAGITSGAGTSTFHTRDRANTKDRVTASTDGSGNRTAVTVDGT